LNPERVIHDASGSAIARFQNKYSKCSDMEIKDPSRNSGRYRMMKIRFAFATGIVPVYGFGFKQTE
jgi:hypothetical protein